MNSRERHIQRMIRRASEDLNLDANETMFLEREATQLRTTVMEIEYPDLIAQELMPLATDIAPSASVYSYKVLVPTGRAKVITSSSDDVPRVEYGAREVFGAVKKLGIAYAFDLDELREAARLNTRISEMKPRLARDTIERGIDEFLAFGGYVTPDQDSQDAVPGQTPSNLKVTGLLNNDDVINNGIGTMTFWTDGSDDATIMNELATLVSAPANASDDKFQANTILLPTTKYNYIKQKPYSSQLGDSMLTVFQRNNPGILVRPWYRLNKAGAAGVPRAVAYKRDPMCLEGVVPEQFRQEPPQARNFQLVTNCSGRCGGVKIYQPVSLKYADFAAS